MIAATVRHSSGSTYVRAASSGSVMIVAGFELTRTTSNPSSRSDFAPCVPGVVELAGLPDDDGARADEEDALDVGAAGHGRSARAGRAREGGEGESATQRAAALAAD